MIKKRFYGQVFLLGFYLNIVLTYWENSNVVAMRWVQLVVAPFAIMLDGLIIWPTFACNSDCFINCDPTIVNPKMMVIKCNGYVRKKFPNVLGVPASMLFVLKYYSFHYTLR